MAIDTIKTNAILDGAVDTADLANGAVTSAKLDTNIDVAGTLDVTGTLTADSNIAASSTVTAVGGMTSSATSGANTIVATNSGTTGSDTAVFQGNAGSYYNQMYLYGNGDSYFQTNGTGLTFGTISNSTVYIKTNNTNRMIIDEDGYVTKPNHPSFWAQTYNTYAFTSTATVEFNSTNVGLAERYDNGGHYNATTGRFTAPVAGTYFFMLTCSASYSSNYLYLYILKNGSDIISRNYAQNSQYIENTLQVVTTLAVGDYVSCKTEKNLTGGALYGPSFCGFLIG